MTAWDDAESLVIPTALRDEAIFRLMSASTAAEYAREARRVSESDGVQDHIRSHLGSDEAILRHAGALRAEVEGQELREAAELELAVLLPLVGGLSSREAMALLETIRDAEGRPLGLRVLAASVLADREALVGVGTHTPPDGAADSVPSAAEVDAAEVFGSGPRTELGRRLAELRRQIVASGEPLLTLDEVVAEVHAHRGEWEHDESSQDDAHCREESGR